MMSLRIGDGTAIVAFGLVAAVVDFIIISILFLIVIAVAVVDHIYKEDSHNEERHPEIRQYPKSRLKGGGNPHRPLKHPRCFQSGIPPSSCLETSSHTADVML